MRTLTDHVLDSPIGVIHASTINALRTAGAERHGVRRARLVHAVISGALTHVWRMEWIASNPARWVQPPAAPRRVAS